MCISQGIRKHCCRIGWTISCPKVQEFDSCHARLLIDSTKGGWRCPKLATILSNGSANALPIHSGFYGSSEITSKLYYPQILTYNSLFIVLQGFDLRVEHSHGWSLSDKNEAGHYHHDLSPETVEYVAYYSVAQKLWRIDRPEATHLVGRD